MRGPQWGQQKKIREKAFSGIRERSLNKERRGGKGQLITCEVGKNGDM